MIAVGDIVVFDVETTGTDKRRDQVIELCMQFGLDAGSPARVWRFWPKVPIHPGAQAVHGISLDDLAGCPPFCEHADELRRIFDRAAVLIGYNVAFDIEMMQAEFARLRQPLLDLTGKKIVDAFRLWQKCEPRSLQEAHRRFVGEEFAAAHSATADVAATGRVLSAMLARFKLPSDWDHIADVCEPQRSRWIGPSHHVQWNAAGQPVIAFGRHVDVPLRTLADGPDRGYLEWIVAKDFPLHVREISFHALSLDPCTFDDWLARRYGRPPLPALLPASPVRAAPA